MVAFPLSAGQTHDAALMCACARKFANRISCLAIVEVQFRVRAYTDEVVSVRRIS